MNVWIALSPMREADGGGLAVAPGSNKDKIAQVVRNFTPITFSSLYALL